MFLLHPSLKHQTHDSRTWSIREWKELARILGEVGNVVVAFRGDGQGERVAAQDIIAGEPTYNARFALGVTLRERAEYACAATISIARDSGPMHVAAAARSPEGAARVIGLFSVMSPDTWTPRSEAFRSLGQWPLPLELCVTPKEVAVAAANWLRELKRGNSG